MFALRSQARTSFARSFTTTTAMRSVPVVSQSAFELAKAGSNQASLESPRNGVEYALSTMDKVVNWARTGSIWPMASSCHSPLRRPLTRSRPSDSPAAPSR